MNQSNLTRFRRYKALPKTDSATQARLNEAAREWAPHPIRCPMSLVHLLAFKSDPCTSAAEFAAAFSDQETTHACREDTDEYAGEACACRLPSNLITVLMCSLAIERAKRKKDS